MHTKFNKNVFGKLAIEYDLSLKQTYVLDYILSADFKFRAGRTTVYIENESLIYYDVDYKQLMKELPLLRITTRMAIYKILNKLVSKKILKRHPDNSKLGTAYYALTIY